MKHLKHTIIRLLAVSALCLLVCAAASCKGGDTPAETDPATLPVTDAPTDPVTEEPTAPETLPETQPETLPETDPETVPDETEPPETVPAGTEPEETEDPMADFELEPVDHVFIPPVSTKLNYQLANQLLTLCSNSSLEKTMEYAQEAGFEEFVAKGNYDKETSDPAHTSAFLVMSAKMDYNGETRNVILVTIRGTYAGEWYSNFDFAPSHDQNTDYAENFKAAADNVFETLNAVKDDFKNPILLICGHSRGAAVANLLAPRVNQIFGVENVFVYTFATPGTVRGEAAMTPCPNVFNFINPLDIVTELPLKAWGYTHLGTDILLPLGENTTERINAAVKVMSALAPDIRSYYEDKHSMTASGLSEDGKTTKELMDSLAGLMMGMSSGEFRFDPSILTIKDESDFKPFADLLMGVMLSGEDGIMGVFGQHLPLTYQQLIQMKEALDATDFGDPTL